MMLACSEGVSVIMQIFVRVKAVGKRREMLERRPLDVPGGLDAPEALIEYLVRENVRAYNTKAVDAPFFPYLSQQALEDGAHTGRIGFGDRKNEKSQDAGEAAANALQCFADGLYRVLINESEALPGMPLHLQDGDTVTFIRLVMLAGWRF
jgi:hypothetical protein